MSIFYELSESEINNIKYFFQCERKLKRELVNRINIIERKLISDTPKNEKAEIKAKLRILKKQLNSMHQSKTKSVSHMDKTPLNPNGYKYGYIRFISTPMGNKR